uniref:non-specific serine/threonine protein kinase n=1 Tax=Paramormyrops kingsleyae TaxID=1676925 RepID=A0A3B3S681_9TELE
MKHSAQKATNLQKMTIMKIKVLNPFHYHIKAHDHLLLLCGAFPYLISIMTCFVFQPRNIFLHGSDCHVKIGDFGLACRDIIVDAQDCEPSASCSFHTTGVGTFVYAAPEQLKGSNYDSKSDMYSMGIVAVELFQPFGTEMERVHTLENVRRGKVPSGFSERWPTLSGYISQLTSPEPCQRPSAAHLLQSELFDGKSRVSLLISQA